MDTTAAADEATGLRAELERARRARTELLSVITHDLRGPLSVIKLASDMLTAETQGGTAVEAERAQRRIDSIRRSAEQITRLIEALQDLASLEDGTLTLDCQPRSSAELLEQAVRAHEAQARGRSIGLQVDRQPEPELLTVDRERMLHVVSGVLDAALRLTREGGQVELGVDRQPEHPSWARLFVDASRISLDAFRDAKAKLLDRRRTGQRALGLGLARDLVEAHGGRIELIASHDGACRFELWLPAPSAR